MNFLTHFVLVFLFFFIQPAISRSKPHIRLLSEAELQQKMLLAAQEMEVILKIAQKGHLEKVGPIDTDIDPNQTGIIGPDDTPIVSTLGQLSAKRAACTPDFAALITRWLYESGVQEGDRVALIATGSIPGFYIAGMCAIRSLRAKPIVQLSLASSEWGMTQPTYTILDLERVIAKEIPDWTISKIVTYGASSDRGKSLSKEGFHSLTATMKKYGQQPILAKTFGSQIQQRLNALYKNGSIKAAIVIGGNIAALGNMQNKEIGAGLIKKSIELPKKEPSMIKDFFNKNIPVIYMHYAESLAKKWGIPFDMTPLPKAGSCERIYSFK